MRYLRNLSERPLPQEAWSIHLNTPLFQEAIKEIFKNENIACIIECGTNTGQGSTQIFAETGVKVLTCEAFKENFNKAKENLKKYKNVKVFNEFTTDKQDVDPIWFRSLVKEGIAPKRSNWLRRSFEKEYKKLNKGESILIFSDTHWTMGFKEFRAVFDYWLDNTMNNEIIFVVDDATNLKHRPTLRFLQTHSELEINYIQKERWAAFKLQTK